MGEALRDAREAGLRGEVPIGAVLVGDGRILGRGGNATEALQDPTVHAEMLAIRQAAAVVGSRRLLSTTLYATLEPCAFWREYLGWFLQPMMQKPALAGRFAMS